MVRLPGHVLPALMKATVVPSRANSGNQPITLTIVLRRDHQAGFERYLHQIYDPHFKEFHHFLTQRQLADRFGPSRADYDAVLAYLKANRFKLVRDSANRLYADDARHPGGGRTGFRHTHSRLQHWPDDVSR
ncbi:MAG: protease pro-enzyme activation domain-containing protein [Candidatus Binataceae bacterium]